MAAALPNKMTEADAHEIKMETDENLDEILRKYVEVGDKATQYANLLRKYPSIVENYKTFYDNSIKYHRYQLANMKAELAKLEKPDKPVPGSVSVKPSELPRRANNNISQQEFQAMSHEAKKQFVSMQFYFLNKVASQLNDRYKKKRPIGPCHVPATANTTATVAK